MSTLNLVGTTLGRFEVLDELGHGGMGAVFRARQSDLDRIVALKVLLPGLTHNADYVRRFRQEARSAARMEHPHIVPVYEVGEAPSEGIGTLHFIAMKFVEGYTLRDMLLSEGRLSLDRTIDIVAQVGGALDYAHQRGMVHRDVKPSNVMITDEGWVYLTDFGLARDLGASEGLTQTGTVMGTPEYMAPEQAEGRGEIGPAADIYALGVVVYQMLSGGLPFEAETPMGMVAARLVHEPRSLSTVCASLPPGLEAVVMRALVRDPAGRYACVADFVSALRAVADEAGRDMATLVLPMSEGVETVVMPQQGAVAPGGAAPAAGGASTTGGATPDAGSGGAGHGAGHQGHGQGHGQGRGQGHGQGRGQGRGQGGARRGWRRGCLLAGGSAFALLCVMMGVLLVISGARDDTPPISPTVAVATPVQDDSPRDEPEDVAELIEQGWDALDNERAADGEDMFEEVLETHSNLAEAWSGLGWSLYYQDEYDEASQAFEEALAREPDRADALLGMGWCQYTLEHYGEAGTYFRLVEEGNPLYANARFGLGLTLIEANKPAAARRALKEALELETDISRREQINRELDRLSVRD